MVSRRVCSPLCVRACTLWDAVVCWRGKIDDSEMETSRKWTCIGKEICDWLWCGLRSALWWKLIYGLRRFQGSECQSELTACMVTLSRIVSVKNRFMVWWHWDFSPVNFCCILRAFMVTSFASDHKVMLKIGKNSGRITTQYSRLNVFDLGQSRCYPQTTTLHTTSL